MELHLRVPADRWCVTFNELFHFVEDVRAAWLAGEILQSEAWQTWRTFVGAEGNELARAGPRMCSNMSRRSRTCSFHPVFMKLQGVRHVGIFSQAAPFSNLRKAIQIRCMSAAVMGQTSTRSTSLLAVKKHGGGCHALTCTRQFPLFILDVVFRFQIFKLLIHLVDCLGCFETA